MLIITPDILKNYTELKVCNSITVQKTIQEHRDILEYIVKQDVQGVKNAMKKHLQDVLIISHKN